MKKMLLLIAVALTFVMAVPAAMAAKPAKDASGGGKGAQIGSMKIGIIDMQRILRESKTAAQIRSTFQKELAAKDADVVAKAKALQKLEEELNRLDANTPDETKRQKVDQFKHASRELTNLRQDLQEEAKRKDLETAQKLFNEIMAVVRNFAMRERYSIIMERSTIVTAEESVDISEKIIKLFDAQKR